MKFCDILVELRKEKNVLQKDVANYLGVQNATVSSWEVGKNQPDYDTLLKLAIYFGVSTDYLLGNAEVTYKTESENILVKLDKQEEKLLYNFRRLDMQDKMRAEGFIEALKK